MLSSDALYMNPEVLLEDSDVTAGLYSDIPLDAICDGYSYPDDGLTRPPIPPRIERLHRETENMDIVDEWINEEVEAVNS